MARVELGMDSETFYLCTWPDWGLWMHRINFNRQKRLADHELISELFRTSLSLYYNWNRGEDNPPITAQQLWPLSYDKPEVTDRQATQEEQIALEEKIKRLESKSKRKKIG